MMLRHERFVYRWVDSNSQFLAKDSKSRIDPGMLILGQRNDDHSISTSRHLRVFSLCVYYYTTPIVMVTLHQLLWINLPVLLILIYYVKPTQLCSEQQKLSSFVILSFTFHCFICLLCYSQ